MEIIIYISAFIVAFANYIVNVSLPLYLSELLNATPLQIGIAGFMGSFAYTLTTFTFSKLKSSQKFPWFIYASFGIGTAYFLIPFFSYRIIILLLFISGFFYGRFWPSMANYFRKSEKREYSVGIYNLSWSGGVMAGSFFSGKIYSFGPSLPFITGGILGISVFFLLFSTKKKFLPFFNINFSQKTYKKIDFPLSFVKRVRLLNFSTFFTVGAITFLFPKFLLILKFPSFLIGILISILYFSRTLFFYIMKGKPHIYRGRISFLYLYILIFFGLLLIGTGNNIFVFTLSMLILGSLNGFSYYNSLLLHLSGGYPVEMNEVLVGAGFFSGPLIVGILSTLFNLRIAFILIGVGILIAGLLNEKKS